MVVSLGVRRLGTRGMLLTLASLSLFTSGCGTDPLANPGEADAARAHIEKLLDVMEQNSINRNEIDWTDFRTAVRAAAPDPQDFGGTFGAVHLALGLLGDNHSSYTGPPGWPQVLTNSSVTCSAPTAPTAETPSDIGYVRVNAFSINSAPLANTYAVAMQSGIRNREAGGATAWIVDLRGNTGGNMWPMIVGLGPILGDNTLGYFVDPSGIESEWKYLAGLAILNNLTVQAINNPYSLNNPAPRVAVFIDGRVASSGEAVAYAFKGRPNTRFFGSASCGLATANSQFNVDGATLNLTTASIVDRNRLSHGETLSPDEVITDHAQLVQRAIAWLRGG